VSDCYFAGTVDNAGAITASQTAVTPGSLGTTSLFVDYIYLDTDERRRFAQVSHEYLIEQLQFTGDESTSSTSNKIKLNFKNKELKSSGCVKIRIITQQNPSVVLKQPQLLVVTC
jgi:hypothetical protein